MKSDHNIRLGDQVEDKVTGYKGIVIALTEWLNGCVRAMVQPRGVKKDGGTHEALSVDVEQLQVLKAGAAAPSSRSGGPMPSPSRGAVIRRR